MGHWIPNWQVFDGFEYKCSECGYVFFESIQQSLNNAIRHITFTDENPICPNCNANMKLKGGD